MKDKVIIEVANETAFNLKDNNTDHQTLRFILRGFLIFHFYLKPKK